MATVRKYRQSDVRQVAAVIADSYAEFNLSGMSPEGRLSMLGPFAYAESTLPEHQEALARAIAAPSLWVAESDGAIVGVLRGGRTDERGRTVLMSLFVSGKHHRQGIGRTLLERFEREYAARGVRVFKVAATLYAVPFYLSLGYRRTTNVRSTRSFGEAALPYQPMKKVLD
jgi:GNAT superfamily N-acetyltransferase